MKLVDILGTHIDIDLDTQPEKDLPRSSLIFQSVGLFAGFGLILGGLPGALIGHFMLSDALGLGPERGVWVGALTGAIVVSTLVIISIRSMSAHLAETQHLQSPIAH
jgi:hypothetical protein